MLNNDLDKYGLFVKEINKIMQDLLSLKAWTEAQITRGRGGIVDDLAEFASTQSDWNVVDQMINDPTWPGHTILNPAFIKNKPIILRMIMLKALSNITGVDYPVDGNGRVTLPVFSASQSDARYLQLVSSIAQRLDTSVELGSGFDFKYQSNNGNFYRLVGYKVDGSLEVVELGVPSKDKSLILDTYNREDGIINNHIQVQWKSASDPTVLSDCLAYVSEVGGITPTGLIYTQATDTLALVLGSGNQLSVVFPVVTAALDGLMAAGDKVLLGQVAADVENLKGLGRIAANLGLNPSQATLTNTWKTVKNTNTVPEGATIVNLDQDAPAGHSWTYMEDANNPPNMLWFDRGTDVVNTASNTSKGIVIGDASAPGKVNVQADGSMLVNGYAGLQVQADGIRTDFEAHKTDFANPHAVTKAQVGLGNADNTSDINKPISISQQNAFDLKQDILVVLADHGGNITLPSIAAEPLMTKVQAVRDNLKLLFSWFTANGISNHSSVADRFTTPRGLQVNLANIAPANFDGSYDQLSIGVANILSIQNGGTGRNDGMSTGWVTPRTVTFTGKATSLPTPFDGTANFSVNITGLSQNPNDYPIFNQDTTGKAAKADVLATKRNLLVALGSLLPQDFDGGTDAVQIGVSGILGQSQGGTGGSSLKTINGVSIVGTGDLRVMATHGLENVYWDSTTNEMAFELELDPNTIFCEVPKVTPTIDGLMAKEDYVFLQGVESTTGLALNKEYAYTVHKNAGDTDWNWQYTEVITPDRTSWVNYAL
jgi:hypothetical protein